MVILFMVIVYLFLILIDIPPLYKEQKWKIIWIYSSLIILAFTLSVLHKLGVEIPSPAVPIEQLVTKMLAL